MALRRLSLSSALLALMASACATEPRVGAADAVPPVAPPAAFQAQLLEDVRVLASDEMQGRDTGSAGGEMARNYIVARFEALGVAAPLVGRLQPWEATGRTREGPKTFTGVNVLGLIPGVRAGDRYIVVTAHYDHVGVHEGQVFNGADDNASGVATLLALAADLKRQAPNHSVVFAAVDGEERGFLGARHFVQAPPFPLASIVMNLNFDMTARAETDGRLWVAGTYQNPQFRPILEALPGRGPVSFAFGKDTPSDLGADNWVEASDHAAFHEAGLPFLYLGVDYHPDYHRPSDDFDKIDATVFTSSTQLSIDAFRALDQALVR